MIPEILKDAEEKMAKATEVAREEFTTIRAGRASAALFSKIVVEYYGSMTPIQQVASITTPEARMAIVSPFRAIRFDAARVGDLSRVIAPPYDVIPPEEQKGLH